jgi:hypothetical protein
MSDALRSHHRKMKRGAAMEWHPNYFKDDESNREVTTPPMAKPNRRTPA